MPIYMDFHHFPDGIGVEEIMQAHVAEVAAQHQFGINYLQYWINSKEGCIYCLMESPDPESCEELHRAVHGNLACNIQQIDEDMLNVFMGMNIPHNNDLALTTSGEMDGAKRVILFIQFDIWPGYNESNKESWQDGLPYHTKHKTLELIKRHQGRIYENKETNSLVAVFSSSYDAVGCAFHIQSEIHRKKQSPENDEHRAGLRISVNYDHPLKETGGFFESSIKNSKRYVMIADPGSIVFSANLKKQVWELKNDNPDRRFKLFSESEESYVQQLFEALQSNIHAEDFDVEQLAQIMNNSRSTLYRKTMTILGMSPNKLITTYRLNTAMEIITKNSTNIQQVAFKVGYSNPSYFSKMFKETFGLLPSEVEIAMN